MISVSGREWKENKVNKKIIEKIRQDYNFSEILSKLIVTRIFDEKEIYLIKNKLDLINVFRNNDDFLKSAELIKYSLLKKEKICILGDYDVDGSASTSLLARFFEDLKHPYFYYIPDREKDGYGPSRRLFEKLILKKPKLVIMVDCGSTAIKSIEYLNNKKIKSLIIDHHEIDKPYPKANVIINPKKDKGCLDYNYLCATALVYFFLEILIKKIKSKMNLKKYLIYVVLATVCDVMPLRKLNRIIFSKALNEFNLNDNLVFKELFKLNNKKNKININDLSYFIGPILNAGGRIGKSNYATELLTTNNIEKIQNLSQKLFQLNNKRKQIENIILDEINFSEIEKKNENIIIYYNPLIKEGLIGIIAARLKDYFNKPALVITNSNNVLKGSARSTNYYNIGRIIQNSFEKKITISGGGHMMAAGFTLKKEKLSEFKEYIIKNGQKMNKSFDTSLKYDAEISPLAINLSFLDEIKKIEPCGNANPSPFFLLKDLKVIKKTVLKNNHISCILKSKNNSSINSLFFYSPNNRISEHLLHYKKYFNVVGQIVENFSNNKKSPQLIIKDLIL